MGAGPLPDDVLAYYRHAGVSFNCGECDETIAMNIYEQWVFDALESRAFAVFTPYKDRGVDCIVTRKDFSGRPQKIQIKGSRTYHEDAGGWYQITEKALRTAGRSTDFWIFVSTETRPKGKRLVPIFLVVPTGELVARLNEYASSSSGRYNVYIARNDPQHQGMIVDTRIQKGQQWPIRPGSERDYTSFADAWNLLDDAIG